MKRLVAMAVMAVLATGILASSAFAVTHGTCCVGSQCVPSTQSQCEAIGGTFYPDKKDSD